MKTVFKTDDGELFETEYEAKFHEAWAKRVRKDKLERNLVWWLANKSRLKSGILRRDVERLNAAWNELQKLLPKTAYKKYSRETFAKLNNAFYTFENISIKYELDRQTLSKAKEIIPRLQAAIKIADNPLAYISKDLLDEPPHVNG